MNSRNEALKKIIEDTLQSHVFEPVDLDKIQKDIQDAVTKTISISWIVECDIDKNIEALENGEIVVTLRERTLLDDCPIHEDTTDHKLSLMGDNDEVVYCTECGTRAMP